MGNNIKGSVHDLQFTNGENSTLKSDMERLIPPYEDEHKLLDVKVPEPEINIYKDLETNIGEKSNLSTNELSFFDNTTFNPECCPSNYSTSSGCACMTPEQMKFLGQRGGNRTMDIQ